MSRWKKVSSLIQKKSFATTLQRTSYTFTPDKDEVIESRFRLRYSTTCNSYYRDWINTIDPSSKGVIPGWEKALYSVDNVHRYINEEIGQVYLEKVPGSSTGCIKWRMDFGCSGLLVDEVTMRLKCVEDYGGEIMITLMGSPGHKRLRYAVGSDYVTYTELENSPELVLTIHFVGDAGQVTQLFPQNILRDMGYPLDIQVTLKPPFQSLGYPRILVGVMYSSSQEVEVDVRHYKENTSQQSGRGFLHIHLYRGRDLPQENNRLPDTFTKCYLLPDAKKSTKCKTRTRKGKDPYWDEQFLVVDINYHEIKRRALEVYVGDSNTAVGKRAKFIGGLRLSLGYNAVVSAQTQKVNQVLHLLKGKGGQITNSKGETGEGKDGHMKVPQLGKLNTTAPKWRGASFARMVIESAKERSNEQDDEEEANCNVKETNISKNGEEIDAGDRPSSLKNKSDIHATGTDKAKDNQTGRLSSTLSTEEQTLACHLDQERSSNAKLEKGPKVDNDHDVKEKAVEGNCETKVSCSNLPKDKEDISEVTPDLKRLCEERKHNADGEGEIETNEALNSQLPTPNTKEVREFCETADEVNSNSKSDENLSPDIKDDNDELENSKIQISSAGPVDGQQQNSETQPSAKDQSEMIELEKSSPTQQLETSNEDSKINHEEEPCSTQTTESNKSNGTQEIVEVCNKVESTEKEDSENHSFHHHQGQQQQELESLPQSVQGLTKQLSPVACFNTGNDKDIKADSLDSLTSLWKEDNCNDMNTCNDTEDLEKRLTIINCQLENDRDEPMGLDQNERFINETKIETPVNCDVENNFNELKAGTDENSLEKNRKREAKLSNLCESSNPENEQKVEKQNGLETNVLKSESLAPVETEKKNHLLNNALKKEKKREVTETIKGEKTTESLSLPKQEEVKLKNVESENNTEQAENKKASGELHEVKRSPSASLRDLSKKLNFKRRSKLNEEETKATDKNLETGANKIMLDAQGLEITQWNLMVERPKQWHYCWHILRSEMTLLH